MVSRLSFEEMEIIRHRAEAFLRNAKYLLENGELHVVTEEILERWYKRFIPARELIEV